MSEKQERPVVVHEGGVFLSPDGKQSLHIAREKGNWEMVDERTGQTNKYPADDIVLTVTKLKADGTPVTKRSEFTRKDGKVAVMFKPNQSTVRIKAGLCTAEVIDAIKKCVKA